MIVQKCKIIKQATSDGGYTFTTDSAVGLEIWVVPSYVELRAFPTFPLVRRWSIPLYGQAGAYIPVELLEFSNIFERT